MGNLYKSLPGILTILFFSCFRTVELEISPDDIPPLVYEELFKNRSFKYEYVYGVKGDITVKASYKGRYRYPDSEVRKGYLKMGLNKLEMNVICIDGYEYEKRDGRWKVMRRDEVINILLDIKRLFNPKRMKFIKYEKNMYVYESRLDVSYIIPGTYKKLKGFIYIDKNFNLRRIYLNDTTSGVFIDLRLYSWDRVKKIKSPIKDVVSVELDRKPTGMDRKHIIKRFERKGIYAHIKGRMIYLDVPLSRESIKKVISGGKAYLVRIDWNGNVPLYFEPTTLVEIKDTIKEIQVDSFYVENQEGRTALLLHESLKDEELPVGILIGKTLYGVSQEQRGEFLIFKNMGTFEDCFNLGLRLMFPVGEYKIIKYRRKYE